MKITNVKITPKLGPQNRDWVLLKVETDEGIEGLGKWSPHASEAALAGVKRMLIGTDPMNINALHYPSQPKRGLWDMGGLGAGVEIALWDIMVKKLGATLYQLLGGKLRDSIRMYINCHSGVFWTHGEFAERWDAVYKGAAWTRPIPRMPLCRWRCR